jgi:hypothetical protein
MLERGKTGTIIISKDISGYGENSEGYNRTIEKGL